MDGPPPPPPLLLQLPPPPPSHLGGAATESQAITVRYILIEPNLSTAVSVDLPDLLPLQSRQPGGPRNQKVKPPKNSTLVPALLTPPAASAPTASEVPLVPLVHVPEADTGGGGEVAAIAPLDAATTPTSAAASFGEEKISTTPPIPATATAAAAAALPCGLRYYIRYESSPRHSRWILEYAHVNDAITDDLPRASRLYGLEQELTLRFTNPPLARGEFLKWPTSKRRVGVFRCTGSGTLDRLQDGDGAVVRKPFFRIGIPTIHSDAWIPGATFSLFAPRRLYSWLPPSAAAAAPAAGVDGNADVNVEDDSKEGLLEQHQHQHHQQQQEVVGLAMLMTDDEDEEGDDEVIKSLYNPPPAPPAKLKKKNNSSLTSFLEFMGMTGSGAPYRSPKKLQLVDTKAKPRVTVSLPPLLGVDDHDNTEALLPQHHPGLERRAQSRSGIKPKDDRVLASPPTALFDGEQPPCAPALKEARPTTPPKKERSGFLVPFLRRINTPELEKNKQLAQPSTLVRSIPAAELTSPPATDSEAQPKGAVRKRRSSTNKKVVRFAFDENTRPYPGERGWADGGDSDGDDGHDNDAGGVGILKMPAPPVPYCSPETTPTTPTSATHHRGERFLLGKGEDEYPDMDITYNTAAAAAASASPSAEGDLLLGIQLTPEVTRNHYEGHQAASPQPQAVAVSLSDISGRSQQYPSPVSPPDPEYIRQVEATLKASFTTDHPQALEEEEYQRQQLQSIPSSPPPEPELAYELDISQMTDEQVYKKKVGPVSNWFRYPPLQVAEEFLPKSKAHWDWPALEVRGWDRLSDLERPGLSVNDGNGIRPPATF